VTFRAGVTATAGDIVLLADISEFQPNISDAAYLAWSKAAVIRAMYGSTHDDRAWYGGARRDGLHAAGIAFLGIYQYLVATQDAAVQAHALVNLLGNLRPREKLICDLEEGPASQQAARWRQWSAVITSAYGRAAAPWLYSGVDFAASAGVSPQWAAAYQDGEPAGEHLLWQFTDAYPVPGVGTADCNRFHGTIDDLAALGWQGMGTATPAPAPAPAPVKPTPAPAPNWTENLMQQLPQLAQGATGTFVRTVQFQCGEHGHPVTVDGVYGPATTAAVRSVQNLARITVDGTVGPQTWGALLA
jgi:peptidoglycan hydrolase-like protein with peptidoglycan-binding domain